MTYLFIILHYHENTLNFTFDCIESIINLENKNNKVHIMVVDNGSNDSSTKKLKEINYENVELVSLNKNLGFSNSINHAAEIGVKKYNPDFIVSANNDTLILSKDFFDVVNDLYLNLSFSILGPKILNKQDKNQNPYNSIVNFEDNWLERTLANNRKLKKYYESYKKSRVLRVFHFRFLIKNLIQKMIFSNRLTGTVYLKIRKRKIYSLNNKKIQKHVALHGSFIIFSHTYYSKFNFLFYPKENFFVEEDILYFLTIKEKLLTIFSPNLTIRHFEDASTNASIVNNIDKTLWILDESIKSLTAFKKLIDKY